MAVVGGTASVLGGGKFANGAMSGAFMHLFNYEYKDALRAKQILEAKGYKNLSIKYGGHGKNSYMVVDKRGFMYGGYLPEEIQSAQSFGRALMIPYGIVGGGILRGGYVFTMMYPEVTVGATDIGIGYYDGNPPNNFWQSIGKVVNEFKSWINNE